MTVYVLVGEAADYEARTTWVVRAYTSMDDAWRDATALRALAWSGRYLLTARRRLRMHDPAVRFGEVDTTYDVYPSEVVDHRMVEEGA